MIKENADLPVMVIDLDGTLIASDTTDRLFLLCCRQLPFLVPMVLLRMLFNRAQTKRWLSVRLGDQLEPARLPYQQKVLDVIDIHRQQGGEVELVSGSDDLIVQQIADHLGLFSFAAGSDGVVNLTGLNKAAFLQQRHGQHFIYVGDSRNDIAVWRVSSGGIGVNAPKAAFNLKRDDGALIEVKSIKTKRKSWRSWLPNH